MASGGEGDPRMVWATLDQAARDAAYNNTAAVQDSGKRIAERDSASARYRAARAALLDVPYGRSERTAFDLYPASEPGAPCLVFLHGGYWQRNSREQFACYAEGLAAVGWSVAMPGYTLAPQATLSGIAAEIGTALDWLDANGAAHGVCGPVLLAGWSAGAQLAAMHLSHPSVAAALAISGVYDLAPIADTFLNAALKLSPREIAALSPLRLPVTRKPMTIAYGDAELPALIHDAHRLHALRDAEGAPGSLLAIEGTDHFSILDELRRPDGRLTLAAGRLLESTRR